MAVTVKIKTKLTGSDARKAAKTGPGASTPDASGANFVSRNDLHVQPTGKKGRTVPRKEVPGLDTSECTVKPVERELNAVERARQANNRVRDSRTNLGRGKPAVPEVGE